MVDPSTSAGCALSTCALDGVAGSSCCCRCRRCSSSGSGSGSGCCSKSTRPDRLAPGGAASGMLWRSRGCCGVRSGRRADLSPPSSSSSDELLRTYARACSRREPGCVGVPVGVRADDSIARDADVAESPHAPGNLGAQLWANASWYDVNNRCTATAAGRLYPSARPKTPSDATQNAKVAAGPRLTRARQNASPTKHNLTAGSNIVGS